MLRRLTRLIDRRLRSLQGITEYSTSQHCIFRMQVDRSRDALVLQDGTVLDAGTRIVVLHLWNEQIPAFPPGGPTLGWARRINRALEVSLRELELYLCSRPELDDVRVIKAEMALATAERGAQLLALAAKYGFEPIRPARGTLLRRIHRLGENILIAMLVLAHNPAAFRADTLRRSFTPVFLSRASLSGRIGTSRMNSSPDVRPQA
jgi:hypothetical protein